VQAGTEVLHCALLGRKLRLVCGDRVGWSWRPAADGPMIESAEPRRNLIERIDARGRAEPVAANVDRLAIVVAPEPSPDWFLVDRYLAGASLCETGSVLIVNKDDLRREPVEPELATYRALRVPVLNVSCREARGVDELRAFLAGSCTMLVGQSGVGKSSIVNALVPEAAAQTAALTRDAEGRHTTTTARWYTIDGASAIIDAPGVRDFAPPANILRAAARAFVEIHATGTGCRFNDCRHFEEPGCAVRDAVAAGNIAARRYESYRRLAKLYEDLAPR
jgi:ribosome biogenesis GTPase